MYIVELVQYFIKKKFLLNSTRKIQRTLFKARLTIIKDTYYIRGVTNLRKLWIFSLLSNTA